MLFYWLFYSASLHFFKNLVLLRSTLMQLYFMYDIIALGS